MGKPWGMSPVESWGETPHGSATHFCSVSCLHLINTGWFLFFFQNCAINTIFPPYISPCTWKKQKGSCNRVSSHFSSQFFKFSKFHASLPFGQSSSNCFLSVPCCTHRSPFMSPTAQVLATELNHFSSITHFCLILILYLLSLIATAHII